MYTRYILHTLVTETAALSQVVLTAKTFPKVAVWRNIVSQALRFERSMNVYSSPVTGRRHKPILPARPLGDAVSTLLGQL